MLKHLFNNWILFFSLVDNVRKLTEELESTVGSATSETQAALDRVYELEAMVNVSNTQYIKIK